LFTDEEKKQLSYLGSMLRRESTGEEAEQEALIEAILERGVKVKGKGPLAQEKEIQVEGPEAKSGGPGLILSPPRGTTL
jgi:hypothetical protein